jgi:hypothetical protein
VKQFSDHSGEAMSQPGMSIWPAQRRRSRLAIASVILGVFSFGLWRLTNMPTPLLGALALAVGVGSFVLIRLSEKPLKGYPIAASGVALGAINLLLVMAHVASVPKESTFQVL